MEVFESEESEKIVLDNLVEESSSFIGSKSNEEEEEEHESEGGNAPVGGDGGSDGGDNSRSNNGDDAKAKSNGAFLKDNLFEGVDMETFRRFQERKVIESAWVKFQLLEQYNILYEEELGHLKGLM